jgi:hypothetical protein
VNPYLLDRAQRLLEKIANEFLETGAGEGL